MTTPPSAAKSARVRRARGVERTRRILDAACELFALHGADAVPMSAVAKAAGTAQGSLYQFFDSKKALLSALEARFADGLRQTLDAVVARGPAVDVRTMVDRHVRAFADFYEREPAYPEVRHVLNRPGRASDVETALDDIIVDHIAGELRRLRPALTENRARMAATVAVVTVDAVLVASADASPALRAKALRQATLLVTRYFEDPAVGR